MLKLESLPNCLICDNKVRNKPVRRYVDEVGRVVTAHTCCVRVENKIEKHQKKLTEAQIEMFHLKSNIRNN